MAAFLSMASFMPIGIPIFVNHQARPSPTSSSNSLPRSSDARYPEFFQTKDQETQAQGAGERSETFFSKMSIFASQPMAAAVPPPSYNSTRHQPPPYISKPRSGSTSTSNSNSKGWFGAMFGGSKTTLSRASQSQTELAPNPALAGLGPDVNLTPLPPTYNPTSPPTSSTNTTSAPHSSSRRQLGINLTASTSTLSISTVSTVTTQPGPQDLLPKYEAIQTPSAKPQLTRSSTRTTSSTSKPVARRPTWSNPYVATDYVDPYEEYELRQRAERERGSGEGGEGDWCCGCFWVGPAHPWQAYYVF